MIFTVEEETGLQGALALDSSLLRSGLLINLDSENPDELIIGCAGAATAVVHLPTMAEPLPSGCGGLKVVLSGLKGGHSGLQIDERHANAIKLLARMLTEIRDMSVDFHLSTIKGGSTHNAIPREATARLAFAPNLMAKLETAMAKVKDALHAEWNRDEPNLTLKVHEVRVPDGAVSDRSRDLLLHLLDQLPHGVLEMSQAFPGKVTTSSNLALVQLRNGVLEVLTSSRSSSDMELSRIKSGIRELGESVGGKVEIQDGYPGWEPDPDSWLLKVAEETYKQVYGHPPEVQIVHGGLECGVIVSKLPGLEAISIGPLIEDAHTTEEHVYASTVAPFWKFGIRLAPSSRTVCL